MDAQKFRALSPQGRALVAIAVLLDGREASVYLENDSRDGASLKKAANELASLEPDLRMPYAGTYLREALKQMK